MANIKVMQQKSEINQFLLKSSGQLLDLSTPKIMGILNITPDSFSDGGQFNNEKNSLLQV